MDLTIADKVKLEYFESPILLQKWALERNLLDNSEVRDKLEKLNKTFVSDKPLTRYEQTELSLLPNTHLVKEWAARNNILNHYAVKRRIKDLENLVR